MRKAILPGLVAFLGCHTCCGGKRKCPQSPKEPIPNPPFAPEVEEDNLRPWQEQYYSDLAADDLTFILPEGLTGQTYNPNCWTHRSPQNSQSKRRRLNEEDGQPLTPMFILRDSDEDSQSGSFPQCTNDLETEADAYSTIYGYDFGKPPPNFRSSSPHPSVPEQSYPCQMPQATDTAVKLNKDSKNGNPPGHLTTISDSVTGEIHSLDTSTSRPHHCSVQPGSLTKQGKYYAKRRTKRDSSGNKRKAAAEYRSDKFPNAEAAFKIVTENGMTEEDRKKEMRSLINKRLCGKEKEKFIKMLSENKDYADISELALKANRNFLENKRKAAANFRKRQKNKFPNAEAAFAIVTEKGMTEEQVKKEVRALINSRLCDIEKEKFIKMLSENKDYADISELASKARADYLEKGKTYAAEERERQRTKFPNAKAAFAIVTEKGMTIEDRKQEVKAAIIHLPSSNERQKFVDMLSENKDYADIAELALKAHRNFLERGKTYNATLRVRQKNKFPNAEAALKIVTENGMTNEQLEKEVRSAIRFLPNDIERKKFVHALSENKEYADISEFASTTKRDFEETRRKYGAEGRKRQKNKFPNAEAAFEIVTEMGMKKEDRKKEVKDAIKYLPNNIERKKFVHALAENKEYANL